MTQRVWDPFLTEQDKAHLAAKTRHPIGFGEKPDALHPTRAGVRQKRASHLRFLHRPTMTCSGRPLVTRLMIFTTASHPADLIPQS